MSWRGWLRSQRALINERAQLVGEVAALRHALEHADQMTAMYRGDAEAAERLRREAVLARDAAMVAHHDDIGQLHRRLNDIHALTDQMPPLVAAQIRTYTRPYETGA